MSMILIDRLGSGSFGEVFACRFEGGRLPIELLTETWAVKRVQKESATFNNLIRELHSFEKKDRNRETARALRIPYRPIIFHDAEYTWIVMEKFTMSCAAWFPCDLTTNDFRRAMRAMLKPCVFLHEKGEAHRDIKPKNMLVNMMTGAIALSDFGSASMSEGPQYVLNQVCTIDTRAPEYFQEPKNGRILYPTTHRADIWSIGMTMLCALLKKPHSPIGICDEDDSVKMRLMFAAKFSKGKDEPFALFFKTLTGAEMTLNLENAVQLIRTLVPNQMARASAKDLLDTLDFPVTPLVRRRRYVPSSLPTTFVAETIGVKPLIDIETSVPESYHASNLKALCRDYPIILPKVQQVFEALYSKKAIERIKGRVDTETAIRLIYLVSATIANGYFFYDSNKFVHRLFEDPFRFQEIFSELVYEAIHQL